MTQLFVGGDGSPLLKPEDVIPFLAKQEKHWKPKYSAYETAYSWFTPQDLPVAVREILQTDQVYANAKLVKATFEKQTKLDETGRAPSQTDVCALLKINSGFAVLGIEGKVNESFGELVSEWNDYSPGKLRRLAGLIERLGLRPSNALGVLRYQLFHRTVATLLECEAAKAHNGVMLVQSFSPDDVRTGFKDFQAFCSVLGAPIDKPGKLSQPIQLQTVQLRFGWTINRMREAG